MRRKEAGRRVFLAAAGLVLLVPAGPVGSSAASAAAPPALEKRSSVSSTDSVSPKTVTASCPAGKRVVGGGGWVFATGAADEAKVLLTRLQPVLSQDAGSYVVTGEEVAPGMTGTWWLEAYALCAPAPAGYELVGASTASSSSSVKEIAAVCPGSKRVLGTGSRIVNPGGQVTLQTNRSSGPRDIVRAVAKEDASGYASSWSLSAYAVCANPLSGFTSVGGGSVLTGSENEKVAFVDCPAGTYVHSAGAASSGTPPGLTTTPPGVAVQVVYPFNNLRSVEVYAVETTPTAVNWDVGAFAICGP
jgi:hypothetical protein